NAVAGNAPPGSVASVVDPSGRFVARGIADEGPIALRVLTLRDEALSKDLFAARIARAGELRRRVVPPETAVYRLIHGEGDRLPGWVCDVYGPFAVLGTDGAGAEAFRGVVTDALRPELSARGVESLLVRTAARGMPARGGDDGPKSLLAF